MSDTRLEGAIEMQRCNQGSGRVWRSICVLGCWLACCVIGLIDSRVTPSACGQSASFDDWFHGLEELEFPWSPQPAESKDSSGVVMASHAVVSIPDSERPSPRSIEFAEGSSPATMGPSESELEELSRWVRWLALRNLPPNIEDNRKWGRQKQVYDGVDMHWDGLRLDTKRRWKMVDHGTWARYFIEFIEPAKKLEIRVLSLDTHENGRRFATRVRIVAPLKIFARVSQFQRDIQWISVSMQADATVALEIDLEVGIRINPLVFPPDVEFSPKATRAEAQLLEFKMHRLSQIHGDLAEWLGKGIRNILDRKLVEYNDKLVAKINDGLAKQKDRLKLSAQEWLSSTFNKNASSR
jgi:hypothetical protein